MESYNTYINSPSGNNNAFEISIIGSKGSGKSSIVEIYTGQSMQYVENNLYISKEIKENHSVSQLYIFDHFNPENPYQYYGVDAVILTIDLTDYKSYLEAFDLLNKNFTTKNEFKGEDCYYPDTKLMIAFTKADLDSRIQVNDSMIDLLTALITKKNIDYIGYIKTTSAAEEGFEQINQLFSALYDSMKNAWPEKVKSDSHQFAIKPEIKKIENNIQISSDEKHAEAYIFHIKKLIEDTEFEMNWGSGETIILDNGVKKNVTKTVKLAWDKIESAELGEVTYSEAEKSIRTCFDEATKNPSFWVKDSSILFYKKVVAIVSASLAKMDVPAEYICSIAQDLMEDSILVETSHQNYERNEIKKWFDITNVDGIAEDPNTRLAFRENNMFPNQKLTMKIQSWKKRHADLNDDLSNQYNYKR